MFSGEELQQLLNAAPPAPDRPSDRDPPPASPEVLKRAQVIADEMKAGASRVSHVTGEDARKATAEDTAARVISDLTADDKLRFMTYVLGGQEFQQPYSLFGGTVVATFQTVSPVREDLVRQLVRQDLDNGVYPAQQKVMRHHQYMLPLALAGLRLDGEETDAGLAAVPFSSPDAVRTAHTAWLAAVTGLQYQILFNAYLEFVALVNGLIKRAADPDFWPTP